MVLTFLAEPLSKLAAAAVPAIANGMCVGVRADGSDLVTACGARLRLAGGCSGANSLENAALVAVLWLLFVSPKRWWKACAFVAASCALAVVLNWHRIAFVCMAAESEGAFGPRAAAVHDLGGYAAFLVLFGAMAWLSDRIGK